MADGTLVECGECRQVSHLNELCPNPICQPGMADYHRQLREWTKQYQAWEKERMEAARKGEYAYSFSHLHEEWTRNNLKPTLSRETFQPALIPYFT